MRAPSSFVFRHLRFTIQKGSLYFRFRSFALLRRVSVAVWRAEASYPDVEPGACHYPQAVQNLSHGHAEVAHFP